MNGQDLALVIRAVDAASPAMKTIGASIQGVEKVAGAATGAFGKMTDTLGKIGLAAAGLKAIVSGVAGIAKGMVSGNAEMERYEVQLGTLLGSVDLAKDRMAELAKFGAETPFELPEIAKAEKVLIGFGLTGQKALQMTGKSAAQLRTVIGDVAAGTGVAFDEIALTFGKFSAGATGEAIARLQELGVVTREQMAAMGVEFSKSGELLSPLPQAMAVAVQIANQKFGGGMAQLSNTFEGRLSTFQDNVNQAKRVLAEPIFERLTVGLGKLNEAMATPQFQAGLARVADLIDKGLTKATKGAVVGFQALQNVLPPFLAAIKPVTDAVGAFVKALADGTGAATAATTAFGPLFDSLKARVLEALSSMAQAAGEKLLDLGAQLVGWIVPNLPKLLANLGSFQQILLAWFPQMIPVIANALLPWGGLLVNWIIPNLPKILGALQGLLDQAVAWITGSSGALGGGFGAWAEQLTGWIGPAVGKLLASLGTLLTSVLTWISANAPAIAAQLGAWVGAFAQWAAGLLPVLVGKLGETVLGLGQWIVAQVPAIAAQIGTWATALSDWAVAAWPMLQARLVEIGSSVLAWIVSEGPKIAGQLGTWAEALVNKATEVVQGFVNTWPEALDDFLTWLEGGSLSGQTGLPGAIGNLGIKLLELLGSLAGVIAKHLITTWIPAFLSYIPPLIGQMIGALAAGIGEVLTSVFFGGSGKTQAEAAGTNFGSVILGGLVASFALWPGAAFKALTAVAPSLFSGIGKVLLTALPTILGKGAPWVARLVLGLSNPVGWAITAATLLFEAWVNDWFGLRTKVTELAGNAGKIGAAIIQGIGKGIGDGVEWLKGVVRSAANVLPKVVRDALGIASPSRVFAALGAEIPRGLAKGLKATQPETASTLKKYIDFVVTEGDYLNDYLAALPKALQPAARQAGAALAALVERLQAEMGAAGESAHQAFAKYVSAVVAEGDHLNDWLSHLPGRFKDAARQIGAELGRIRQMQESTGPIRPAKPSPDFAPDPFHGNVVGKTFNRDQLVAARQLLDVARSSRGGVFISRGDFDPDPLHGGILGKTLNREQIVALREILRNEAIAARAVSRDLGGPLRAGQMALVGRGAQPELFVPSVPGTMHPRGTYALGGPQGSAPTRPIVVHPTVRVYIDERELRNVHVRNEEVNYERGRL